MPNIVDLKLTPEEKKDDEVGCCSSDRDYPWGLELDLGDDEVQKLGVEGLEVGEEVLIAGTARVSSKGSHQVDGGDKDSNMSIQITGLSIAKGSKKSAANTLYGDSADGKN